MSPSSLLPRLLLPALLTALLAPLGFADDVATANSHLKRAEVNLELVNGSIGHLTKPPRGSAAKLAGMRLGQALGDITAAGELLTDAEGDGLAEAVSRYNADVELHNQLRAILTGEVAEPEPEPEPEPAPEPEPGPEPEPEPEPEPTPEPEAPPVEEKPKTVKLGYPHADNFKNTLFTLRRVEADTAAVVALLEKLRPVKDQLSINHRETGGAVAKIKETYRQAGFVDDGLAKIPANGEGVAEAKQRLVVARAKLGTSDQYFQPLHKQLIALIDMANYPNFHADVKRLRELASAYGSPSLSFRDQRAQGVEAFEQADAAKAECIRIAQTYARLMEQGTDQGQQVEATGNNFLTQLANFQAEAEKQKLSLPGEIRADLAEANTYAEQAVAEQKPLFFTGGIPQRMEWAQDKLMLLEALDPASGAVMRQEVGALEASLAARADSLKELIIRENELPLDRFLGADRDAAIAVAVDAWEMNQPGFELLTVRVPSESWSRDTKWSYSNGTWYFIDVSSIQVRLIVADTENPDRAIDRAINIRKDHQKNDRLIGVPLYSLDEPLQPSHYLLRSKIP